MNVNILFYFLSKYALRWITTRREDEGGRDFFLFCGEAKLASFSFHFTKSVDLLREIHYCVKLFCKKNFLARRGGQNCFGFHFKVVQLLDVQ